MKIIHLLFELVPCLIIGYLIGKFKADLSVVIARPLIKFGIPISLMGLLLKTGINLHLIEAATVALIAIGFLMAMLNYIPKLREQTACRTLALGSGFGNTGYFGIPVSIALLPNAALSYSLGFDIGATLVIWSLGPFLLNNNSTRLKSEVKWKRILKALVESPASKGVIGSAIIQLTPWNEAITSALWVPSKIVIVLALVIVGMNLGWIDSFNFSTMKHRLVSIKTSLVIKLIGLPTLMLILCNVLNLPTMMKNALVLQAAAPTAISILLIAQSYSQDEDKATSLVVMSTIVSLITIPIWSLLLKL